MAFYVNHTVRADQEQVIALLEEEGRTAFVSPTIHGYTVVCDAECEGQDPLVIAGLGQKMSSRLQSPVLAVLNHDDDILCYWLFEGGELIEEHDAYPESLDDDSAILKCLEDVYALKGHPFPGQELCRVFGTPALRTDIASILTSPATLFAVEIHQKLATALGLPACAVGSGYRSLAEGDAVMAGGRSVHVGRGVKAGQIQGGGWEA